MGRPWLGPAVVVALATQLAGCSLAFMDKTPDNVPPGAWMDCTESRVFPGVDTVFGVSMLIGSIGIASTAGEGTENEEDAARVAAPLYAVAGIGLPQPQPQPPPAPPPPAPQ